MVSSRRGHGLRNRTRTSVGTYSSRGKAKRADRYDKPLTSYRDPLLDRSASEEG